MKKPLLLIITYLFLNCFELSAQYVVKSDYILNPDLNIGYVENNAQFWIDHAYDTVYGGFFSNVDKFGNVLPSTNVHTNATYYRKSFISQTRHGYGFTRAFMLTGNENYLTYAQSALDFLTTYGWDLTNGGWYCFAKADGSLDDGQWWNPNTGKWGFQQHYALVGIIANYEATRNANMKTWMDNGINALYTNMWDSRPGFEGYYLDTDLNWSNKRGKGFTPTVDGITTNAELTYLITKNPDHKERLLQMANNIVEKIVPNMDLPNIKVLFPEEYSTDWVYTTNNSGSIGHFIKTAWVLGRAYLCDTSKTEYKAAAIKILDEAWTYKNGTSAVWDHVNGGSFNAISITTGLQNLSNNNDNSKDYWTLEQGFTGPMINYYITQNPNYLQMADESMLFFMNHLVDNENGEIFSQTDPSGATVRNSQKGDDFKASYHSIEMGYYGYLYSNLYYLNKPASLYYKFEPSSEAQNISLSPIPMEDDLLKITSVTLDGIDFQNYDATTRTLNIAANQGGKFRVTFESTPKTNTSLTTFQRDQISVFPNPTSGLIHVKGLKTERKISVVDLAGKVLLEEQVDGNPSHDIDISHLGSGIYFIVLQQDSGLKITKKVIKQ